MTEILETLLTVLDEEYARAVIDHRRKKKSPLTPLAAKILAKQFGLCADPRAGVEEMLNRGWTGFKAEWMPASSGRSVTGNGMIDALAGWQH